MTRKDNLLATLFVILLVSATALTLATDTTRKVELSTQDRVLKSYEFEEIDKIASNKFVSSITVYDDTITIETVSDVCVTDTECEEVENSILNDNQEIVSEIIFN